MQLLHGIGIFLAKMFALVGLLVTSLLGGSQTNVTILPPAPSSAAEVATTSNKAVVSAASSTSTRTITRIETTPPAKTAGVPPAQPPSTATLSLDPQLLNSQTRDALVNILCTTLAGGSFQPISGSGVIIDSRGVILTNAHLGQFFLLRDYPVVNNIQCMLRTGSPAQPKYLAELLYLPPAWINANASQLISQNPTGTGENDYAFLRITGSVNTSTPLPSSFPALAMSAGGADIGENAFLAAYPAGFLSGAIIQSNLYISSSYTIVQKLFSFSETPDVELISIGGTVVSQSGSSGGAVVRTSDGKLIGIIATETTATTTAQRDLRAITLLHINKSLVQAGQGGIAALLSGDLAQKAAQFASTTAPSERKKLIDAIERK